MPASKQEFKVAIDGLTLTAAQRARLNSAIQKAALGELADMGLRQGFGARIPREWLGIWIGPLGPFLKGKLSAGKR
jgi:hypothetical protein